MKERAEKAQGKKKKRNEEKTKQKRWTVVIQMLVHCYLWAADFVTASYRIQSLFGMEGLFILKYFGFVSGLQN
jgi:hypothetical protein